MYSHAPPFNRAKRCGSRGPSSLWHFFTHRFPASAYQRTTPCPTFFAAMKCSPRRMITDNPLMPCLDSLNLLYKSARSLSSEEPRERRTIPASKYRYLSQTQLRSKLYRNSAKSDRRNQVTLSIDVPTNIMNILFNIAKAKNLRAKADDNARLLAQIGKRKWTPIYVTNLT